MNAFEEAVTDLTTHANAWASALRLAGAKSSEPFANFWLGLAERYAAGVTEEKSIQDRILTFGECFPFLKAALCAAEQNEADQDDAGYWSHEVRALKRVESVLIPYQMLRVTLEDWRKGVIPEVDDEPMAAPTTLSVGMRGGFLDIQASDGRMVSIELEGGNLRVLSYNQVKDEPFLVKIPVADEISAEDREYRAGARIPVIEAECNEDASMSPAV